MAVKDNKISEAEDEITVVDDADVAPSDASGDLDSSKEEEKVKKETRQPARKRGNDGNKRINELWMQRKEAEESASKSAALAHAEKAKNIEYEKITAAALEENLNTKRELLTERLVRAQENGDNKKSAEITAELSKIEAQAAQIDRYKIESQVRGADQKQLVAPTQQREPLSADEVYESMSPAGKKWMDDNRDWYDASGDNHDPEKAADITYYAQTLENEYRQSGRGAEIGTRAYFKKVDDYIKGNWSDDVNNADEEAEVTAPPKKNYAAPVGNRSAAYPPPGARKEYKITQSEKEMALSLDSKGKDGKPLSDSDKIKRFLSIRESIPVSGPIAMSTIRKGA